MARPCLRARSKLSAVAVVLCSGCRAEVCLSVVEAIVIDVVNEYVIWDFENLAVHFDNDSLFLLLEPGCAHGVEGAFAPLMCHLCLFSRSKSSGSTMAYLPCVKGTRLKG